MNLSTIITTATYNNGTTKDVSNSVSWSKISGDGIISGTTFTAPATQGTTILRVDYSEGGITRSANLNITISQSRILGSIQISPKIVTVSASGSYNLLNIATTAYYSDFTTDIVTTDSVNWMIIAGGGTLSGNFYAAPSSGSTVTLRATYTEDGVSRTADLTLTIIGARILTSVAISPTSTSVQAGQTYYLNSLLKTAKYGDNSTSIITSSYEFSKISGNGVFNYTQYKAPANAEIAVFSFSYSENGVTKSTNFTLNVTASTNPDGVYTITKTVTSIYGMTYEQFVAMSGGTTTFPKTYTDTITVTGGIAIFGQAVTDQVTGTNNNSILYGKKFFIGQSGSNDTDSIWNGTLNGTSVSGTHEIIPYVGNTPSPAQSMNWTYTGTKQ